MNSFSFSVLNTIVLIPCGDILNLSVAYLSVIPLPENALISGNRACRSGSKLDASYTSNCSRLPSTFGKLITVECLEALLSTTVKSSCLNASAFRLYSLNSFGKDNRATALCFTILLRLSVLADQNLSDCAKADTIPHTKNSDRNSAFFIL
jgi:hypothetical protein